MRYEKIEILYDGKPIELIYNGGKVIKEPNTLKFKVEGIGIRRANDEEYDQSYGMVEQEAQLSLIRNANKLLHKKHTHTYILKSVENITQTTILEPIDNCLELEISLTGIAWFLRK